MPKKALSYVIAITVLTLFYVVTAPRYHVTAIDSYAFAQQITEGELFTAATRLFLWLTSMQTLYSCLSWLISDPFELAGIIGAIQTAVAIILLERLLTLHFASPPVASLASAGIFAISYGTWRYATELEVYASAAMMSLLLLHGAFLLRGRIEELVGIAIFGVLCTLFYEPLGIVAAISVPVFIWRQFSILQALIYGVLFGLTYTCALVAKAELKGSKDPFSIQAVLDTDGKLPRLPEVTELIFATVAALQNILSANWAFAFGPVRNLIQARFSHFFFQELVASEAPNWTHLFFLLTVPAAVLLLFWLVAFSVPQSLNRPLTAPESAVLAWLIVHSAMALSLHPTGFETWLPALVPIILLAGSRIARPVAEARRSGILWALLAVLMAHNWFAGVAIFAWASRDYNLELSEPIVSASGANDLLVVQNWALAQYLIFTADADTMTLTDDEFAESEGALTEKLSNGGSIFLIFEAMFQRPEDIRLLHLFGEQIAAMCPEGEFRRIDLGVYGYTLAFACKS